MATIGLDKLFYAPITEEENGDETYGSPVMLAKAMTAELSIELNEAILYADDGPSEIVKEFKNGALSLGVDDIGVAAARALTGAQVDDNGVLISASENDGSPVAVASAPAKQTAHTGISGCTGSNSRCQPPTSPPRATASPSLPLLSKARSCAATSWTARASTRGRLRSTRTIRVWQRRLFPAGITPYMSLCSNPRRNPAHKEDTHARGKKRRH